MSRPELLWLAGAIWLGLGIAHDNWVLRILALAALAAAAYEYRKAAR